ncbi:MiaB/RimO family radical SAM methylthiotransferase [uncultured Acetatifactor sp.]|uniref:MiaB/RimO family radical SAM methylthiotransferase n=1 Tax=uncultured Acetatifactor sp. TaxID=1671927 RepID=UPI00260DA2E7|nr:MiaB/RimO family radical SAM methylthiotransferase [uncultured Acetatifactor sp.]
MKTVALYNLGCKVNSYEMEVMRQILREKGYGIVAFDERADIYIVNTCTVTNIADRKSRQMLHRARQLNPDAVVVAVGCYVQTGREAVEADPGVDLAIGNNRKKDIAAILEEYLERRREGGPERDKTLEGATVLDIGHTYEYEEMRLKHTAERTRAYIKIQDGCNQFCSYCAIPYARGRVRSRRAEDVLEEVRGLVDAGYREVVLTGIHISSYGIDFGEDGAQAGSTGGPESGQESVLLRGGSGQEEGDAAGAQTGRKAGSTGDPESGQESVLLRGGAGQAPGNQGALREEPRTDDRARERKRQPAYNGRSRLVELVEQIHGIEGLERIRLGSLEPRIVTPEAVRRLAALPKLCPHFHLSLQSGCDATLKRMNRHYTAGEYYKSVELLRECFHRPAITTDVIAGFPGETEAEFADTREFLEKAGFYEMHVFKYSRREGTAAASMPDQVPEPVKARRSAELIALGERQSLEFRRRYIGKEAEALLEETREIGGRTYCIGHTKDYVKVAVDVTERLQEAPAMINTVVKIPVRDFLTDEILM